MDIGGMTLRLILAVLFGGAVGVERETSHKPAGLRTHILICVSATMMMILVQLPIGGLDLKSEAMRMAAGVITGIGFLGAGTILQARGSIHGLTTASTIWAVAGLGLVLGAGHYALAGVFTLLVVLTLVLLRSVEGFIGRKLGRQRDPHADR
jgi:putative Mg2+ transporter-C (MgtC) family protein